MIASTRLPLPKGRWVLPTSSDDGVRVQVDGKIILENWTWHGPERNEAAFEATGDREVLSEVEHFEIDGHAELQADLEAQKPATPPVENRTGVPADDFVEPNRQHPWASSR